MSRSPPEIIKRTNIFFKQVVREYCKLNTEHFHNVNNSIDCEFLLVESVLLCDNLSGHPIYIYIFLLPSAASLIERLIHVEENKRSFKRNSNVIIVK